METFPLELLTCAEMAAADRFAIDAGTPGSLLMERAGAAVADAARQLLARNGGTRVAILCGPGNNGGDGFVAARLLAGMGHAVDLGLLGDPALLRGDAAQAAAAWTSMPGPSGRIGSASLIDFENADLAVDALFGAGLARDIDGRARALIERLNAWRARTGKPVVAVDVPSGIDGDSGAVRGVAVEADVTMTFFRLKPGHLLLPGRVHCGRIALEDIGIPASVLRRMAPAASINAPALWSKALRPPSTAGHKYDRGHVLVVSGPAHQGGAARLAARGALRGGAGLVTLASTPEGLPVHAAHLTAIMLAPCAHARQLAEILDDARKNAVALGPGAGVGGATRVLVETALRHPNQPAVVLDADAITSLSGRTGAFARMVKAGERPVILTPHDGEFSRLFKLIHEKSDSSHEIDDSLHEEAAHEHEHVESLDEVDLAAPAIWRARAAARALGVVMCLKGAATIVAAPDGRVSIMPDAPAWLATAGSGDVLTGMIAAQLAQGLEPFTAASAAVWMHADAARRHGPGLISEDIPEHLPAVWARLAGRNSS